MSSRSFALPADLQQYVLDHSPTPDAVLQSLIDETAALGPAAGMQIGADQGALFTLLTAALGVTRAIEVGTFTGYSALCIARGLAPGGTLLCCDVSEAWTAIGRRHWDEAGVGDRIELRLGPALDTLRSLPLEPTYDLAFVDADKPGYVGYVEELAPRLRSGALLLVDNVLWSGAVVDPAADDENTVALRRFNDWLAADDRFESTIVPLGDGVTFARRR